MKTLTVVVGPRALVRAVLLPMRIILGSLVALKKATWGEAREAIGHIADRRVSGVRRGLIVPLLMTEFIIAAVAWVKLHLIIPIGWLTLADECYLVGMMMITLWWFNNRARLDVREIESTDRQ